MRTAIGITAVAAFPIALTTKALYYSLLATAS